MPVRHALPPLLSLLLIGCGAAEYEAKMKSAQERLKRHDEEVRLIGPPVSTPTAKNAAGDPAPVAAFFLRLPITLPTKPTDEPVGLFYDYVPAQKAGPFDRAKVAFAKADDADFANRVVRALGPTTQVTPTKVVTQPPGRKGVAFTRMTFDGDAFSYSVNVHQDAAGQMAVVYQIYRGQAAAAARPLELSLDSFGFGSSMADAQKAYRPSGLLDGSVPPR